MVALSEEQRCYKIANLLLLSFHICVAFRTSEARNLISPNNTDREFDFTVDSGCNEEAHNMAVQVTVYDNYVVMENGIVEVTLLKPSGFVAAVKYNGIDNLLELSMEEDRRGYWDIDWSGGGEPSGEFDMLECTSFATIMASEEQVELSFTRRWDPSLVGIVPLNIDKRFVMLRGSSGFYTYAIYEHLQEWPAFSIGETRVVLRPRKDKFKYMAISDEMQRYMPLPEDRLIPERAQPLAYKEAVLLVNPLEPQFRGEVDDKYQYSSEHKDQKVQGWISQDPPVGFWQIMPSSEFRSGGPLKQELTSHVGPTHLSVFHSTHYCGEDMGLNVAANEAWKKVLGPIFIYLNSFSGDSHATSPNSWLWQDANIQMGIEEESWPYSFPNSADYYKCDQRGVVNGRLRVRDTDSCIGDGNEYPQGAYVGLAAPGDYGSWQTESKGYQFWTRTDRDGYFYINNVRVGDYNLYAWVPGFIGDYKYHADLKIAPGSMTNLGEIVYEPPRDGPTLWEIGIPDRSAAEFYIPDPNPMYLNKLYVDRPDDRFRQYGLWDRYRDLYPDEDLVYTVGMSDYEKDWFYAQVTRWRNETRTFIGTTWQIKFALDGVDPNGTYKLRLALASVTHSELQVRVNDPNTRNPPLFSSGYFGRDNSIARHGIHGLYRLFFVDVPGNRLVRGSNTIFLTQPRCKSPFEGIMYDYIRLEAP